MKFNMPLGHAAWAAKMEGDTNVSAGVPDMNPWIKCTERMPEKRGFVLVYDRNRIRLFEWYPREGGDHSWYNEEDNQFHGTITHWMPLPPAPEKEAS